MSSVWSDQSLLTRRIPLEGDITADVAVVGAGIAGLSVAYALAREGVRPVVLEHAGFTGHGNAFAVAGREIVASLIRTGRHPDADLFDPDRP